MPIAGRRRGGRADAGSKGWPNDLANAGPEVFGFAKLRIGGGSLQNIGPEEGGSANAGQAGPGEGLSCRIGEARESRIRRAEGKQTACRGKTDGKKSPKKMRSEASGRQ